MCHGCWTMLGSAQPLCVTHPLAASAVAAAAWTTRAAAEAKDTLKLQTCSNTAHPLCVPLLSSRISCGD